MNRRMKILVSVLIVVLACVLTGANKPKSVLPGRVPMHQHLLVPSAEWTAYYDVVPEGERALYWTTKTLLDVAREQVQALKALDARLVALEPKPQPKSAVPTEPNAKPETAQ